MTDRELVCAILFRDKRALSLFYHTYAPLLRRFIASKIENPHDAEEVLQDTLFAFLEALRDFHEESSVKTFLYAICHHKVIDWYRKKKLKAVVFSRMPELEKLVSPLHNPEEALDAAILKEQLQKTLKAILPRYQKVLRLKYFEEYSISDIAKECACTFKSAESMIFRARKAFVKAFAGM